MLSLVMENFELVKGQVYRIRLTNGTWTNGVFLYIKETSWLKMKTMKHFMFRNIRTDNTIEIKSRQRIRQFSPEQYLDK